MSAPINDSLNADLSEGTRKVQRKSKSRKAIRGRRQQAKPHRDKRFSLHINCGKRSLSLVLVQYQCVNFTLCNYPYSEPLSDLDVLKSLRRVSDHTFSIIQAVKKWREFRRDSLARISAEKANEARFPTAKVVGYLKTLEEASGFIFAEDKDLKSQDNKMFMTSFRKTFWRVQSLTKLGHPRNCSFDADDIAYALEHVLQGVRFMQKDDPHAQRDPSLLDLASSIWEWWGEIQPILSNKSGWSMTQAKALARRNSAHQN